MYITGKFTSYGYYYIILETKIQFFFPKMQKNGMKCKKTEDANYIRILRCDIE